MEEEPLKFEQYRQRRDDNCVRCARCGKWILATVIQCPKCGIHFEGEAQYFAHPSERKTKANARSALFVTIVLILLATFVIQLIGLR